MVLGGLYACVSLGLLWAASIDASVSPPTSISRLVVLSWFAATAASFFTVGGYFLRNGFQGRYSLQLVFLPFAIVGATYPIGVVIDVYS